MTTIKMNDHFLATFETTPFFFARKFIQKTLETFLNRKVTILNIRKQDAIKNHSTTIVEYI